MRRVRRPASSQSTPRSCCKQITFPHIVHCWPIRAMTSQRLVYHPCAGLSRTLSPVLFPTHLPFLLSIKLIATSFSPSILNTHSTRDHAVYIFVDVSSLLAILPLDRLFLRFSLCTLDHSWTILPGLLIHDRERVTASAYSSAQDSSIRSGWTPNHEVLSFPISSAIGFFALSLVRAFSLAVWWLVASIWDLP